MLLGFKTQIQLQNSLTQLLAKHAGVARHAWNWGLGLTKAILDHNQNHPEDKIKFPSAIDLHKWLVAKVKSKNPWYYEVSRNSAPICINVSKRSLEKMLPKERWRAKI